MKNKKLLILFIFAILFVVMSFNSVSANDGSNMTKISKDNILESSDYDVLIDENDDMLSISDNEDSNKLKSSLYKDNEVYQIKIQINTKNYTDCYCGDKLTFSLVYKVDDSNTYSISGPYVKYIVTNAKGKIVYKESISRNFKSNYKIFKDLPDGTYTCSLTSDNYTTKHNTTFLGDTFIWKICVDSSKVGLKTEELLVLTKDYNKYDNIKNIAVVAKRSRPIAYAVFNSNHKLIYHSYNSNVHNEETLLLKPNYKIFKDLPNGNYICALGWCDEEDYDLFMDSLDITWNVTKTKSKTSTSKTESKTSTSKTKVTSKSKHYIKYIKVGKYKVKVWSDDNLNTQKNKVIKYLKSHVKKGHTLKVKGYKFTVSAKMYMRILYYKKYGYDGKFGYSNFKVKTNKYYTVNAPIYKTKKVTKKVWKYKKVLSYRSRWGFDYFGDNWYEDKTYDLTKYYKKGWQLYGFSDKKYSNGQDSYAKLKKKVKTTVTIKERVGYGKVKLKVYAYGVQSKHKVGVQFWGLLNGKKYRPITNYYLF